MNVKLLLKKLFHIKTKPLSVESLISIYKNNGHEPWSTGYTEYKELEINRVINDSEVLEKFRSKISLENFGFRIDERIVEYPWIFANINSNATTILDAGSTMNFKYILENSLLQSKEIAIATYYPEPINFNEKRISYVYSDLRNLPFKDNLFDIVICHSTLEHIDMNNEIYGYDVENNSKRTHKSYEYLKSVQELIRVLKNEGQLLITFPYGKHENHDYFQQFDKEMLDRILVYLNEFGRFDTTFFKYIPSGWIFAEQEECNLIENYNPITGIGKGTDGAAHSRGICCINFVKKLN